jgi:ribosomal protein S19
MPRSLKNPFVAYHLLKKINKLNKAGKRYNYNLVRSSTILPSMIGFTKFTTVNNMYLFILFPQLVGHKLENLYQQEISKLILKLIENQNVK